MLQRIGIYGQAMIEAIVHSGVFACKHFAECRPTTRGGIHVAMDRAIDIFNESAARKAFQDTIPARSIISKVFPSNLIVYSVDPPHHPSQ